MCGGSRIVYPSRIPTLIHIPEELRKQFPPQHHDHTSPYPLLQPCFSQIFPHEDDLTPPHQMGMFFTVPLDETVSSPDFLRSCFRCRRSLTTAMDIYMYRGDEAFCSPECRYQQMDSDELKEKALSHPISCKSENEAAEKSNDIPEAVVTVEIAS